MKSRIPFYLSRLTGALALVALTACATPELPRVDVHPVSGQKQALALHHWDVLADDVAQRVAAVMDTWPETDYVLSVAATPATTTFDHGFRKLLITRLVDKGIAVSLQPSTIELKLDAQVVQHATPLNAQTQAGLSRLSQGVWVEREGQDNWDHQRMNAVASYGQGPGSAMQGGHSRTEILVTTSLEGSDRYLARTADIYYIDPMDAVLYNPAPVPPAPPPPPPPVPVKNWKVVAP